MTTKFNKELYAKMRSKKSEPLSNLGKKAVRVTGKSSSALPISSASPVASGVATTRTASPTTSLEEIEVTPASKRPRLSEKEKEKEKSVPRPSTLWTDERLAVDRAHEVVTAADLKVLSGVPFNDVAARHVHKLVQVLGESMHIASEYLTQETKVASLTSRMETLEAKNSTLRKNLIESMGESASLKEKLKTLEDELRVERQLTLEKDEQLISTKESLKTIAARSIEAFQTTEEYSTVLFSWYFKGFELLRRYLLKHPSGVDMEKLDLEEVDQEMAADEAGNSSAIVPFAREDAPADDAPATDDAPADDGATNA
ncbi:uncharacterized protein LOC111988047 [Quercus suber]|uniref:uncharacterized protein LOC111988047 n=1 Tax=Quercus suber TaxID=58331 RepID=UPI0032DF0306